MIQSFLISFFTSKKICNICFLPSKACTQPLMYPECPKLAASEHNHRCHFLSGTEIIQAEPTSSLTMVISISMLSDPFVILPFPHTWHHQLPGKLRQGNNFVVTECLHYAVMLETVIHNGLAASFIFCLCVLRTTWYLFQFFAASRSAWFGTILTSSLWSWHLKHTYI